MPDDEELQMQTLIEAFDPALVAIEKYVVELLRLSRFSNREIESAVPNEYLIEKRHDAIREVMNLRKFAP